MEVLDSTLIFFIVTFLKWCHFWSFYYYRNKIKQNK